MKIGNQRKKTQKLELKLKGLKAQHRVRANAERDVDEENEDVVLDELEEGKNGIPGEVGGFDFDEFEDYDLENRR